MTTICIFGDSITQGAYDSQGGWAQRLKKYCTQKEDLISVFGVDGDTSTGLLQRLEREASPLKPDLIIIAIGINDSVYDRDGNVETSLEQFNQNMKRIIGITKRFTFRILILGLTCVDEKKTTPIPWNNWFYANEKIKQYDHVLKDLSLPEKIMFLELFPLLSKKDLEDGLHPTDEGHRKIFEAVKKKLFSLF